MPRLQDIFGMLPDTPSPHYMRELFDRYRALMSAGDIDGVIALFTEDAVWEEPVGSTPAIGHDAIRARYAAAIGGSGGSIPMQPDGAVRIAGRRAVAASIADVNIEGTPMTVETANVIEVNEDGLIKEMKVYVSAEMFKPKA